MMQSSGRAGSREMNSGVCISTVSIVCSCEPALPNRARVDQIGAISGVADLIGSLMAGAADGADGMSATPAHADHSRSSSALPGECNLDAQGPQEHLRPPQSAGERSRRFWPSGASLQKLVTGK